ncbi:HEAT repeat domain-containing protein [Gimesia algae]|uniref:PBS lyase HEAT-like repeat protein n=1 Tax=Gimesia algae TaxID=2527971 RepID=A0A517V700_9PLAN|nr:HEAT repeat domain-containing protein [Gimesia algae]QDT88777.1 PBS lyase HEAT-like repeat protein [Gimesia algae]
MTDEANQASSQSGSDNAQITEWIQLLGSTDSEERQTARRHLANTGEFAVPALITALGDSSEMLRWEAAKTLGEIRSPSAIPALIEMLKEDFGVKWVAGDALIALSETAVPPLLKALIHETGLIRDGACYVLHHLAGENDNLRETLRPVVEALKSLDSSLMVPVEAEKALSQLSEPGL